LCERVALLWLDISAKITRLEATHAEKIQFTAVCKWDDGFDARLPVVSEWKASYHV